MKSTLQRDTRADTIILFVHGIQGSPSQFNWLADRLPEQVDYMCLLLPGHGASAKEFAKAGHSEWLSFVQQTIDDLSEKYRRIIYVGHSMGCLLGILAANRGGEKICGMLLLACPLKLRPTLRYALNNWRSVIQQNPSDPWVKAAKEANSVRVKHPFEYLMCIKPYLGLLWLMWMTRKELFRTNDFLKKLPVVAVHSDGDEIVGKKSLELLKCQINAKTQIVPASGHFLYSEKARQSISDELMLLLDEAYKQCCR